MEIRAYTPPQIAWRDWRGALITAISDEAIEITVQDGSHRRVVSVAVALVPAGARTIHCPVAVRLDEADAARPIVEVVGSSFGPGDERAVMAGEYRPGIVPRAITRQPRLYWSAADPHAPKRPEWLL